MFFFKDKANWQKIMFHKQFVLWTIIHSIGKYLFWGVPKGQQLADVQQGCIFAFVYFFVGFAEINVSLRRFRRQSRQRQMGCQEQQDRLEQVTHIRILPRLEQDENRDPFTLPACRYPRF